MGDEEHQEVGFCVQCFATELDGSMGGTVIGEHCTNCGASGAIVKLSQLAVKSIRDQASWVGKRYYSQTEDFEQAEELKRLRGLMTSYPGRTAKMLEGNDMTWIVTQQRPVGSISIFCSADSMEDAIEQTKASLPYFSQDMLLT